MNLLHRFIGRLLCWASDHDWQQHDEHILLCRRCGRGMVERGVIIPRRVK
jgi:hypothetical protein